MQSSKPPRFSLLRSTIVLGIAASASGILVVILTLLCGFERDAFLIGGFFWGFFLSPFVLLDGRRRLGWKNTFIFIGLIAGLSFIAEHLGSKYGFPFGDYTYQKANSKLLDLMLFNQVPLYVICAWCLIVYLAFATTNTLIGGFTSNENPSYRTALSPAKGGMANILWLPLLAVADGLIATNLDLIMDPVAVEILGRWTWHNVGANYCGIPLSNFAGWFVAVFLISLIFRTYLWTSSSSKSKARIPNSSSDAVRTSVPSWLEYVSPLLCFIFQLRFSIVALQTGHSEYAFVGIATTLPLLLVAILLFQARRRKQ